MSRKKFNYNEFFTRLYIVAKQHNISKAQLYDILGVSAAYVSMLKANKVGGSFNMILNFAENFTEINITWLLFGEGEMFLPEAGENRVKEQGHTYTKPPLNELQTLFSELQQRPQHEQEAVAHILKGALQLLNK